MKRTLAAFVFPGLLQDQALTVLIYVIVAGVLFAVLFALLAAALLPLLLKKRAFYLPLLSKAALFTALLFLWGGVANSVWSVLPTDRWWVAADVVVFYLPVIPFGEWSLDRVCGGHLLPGVSMWVPRALWLLVTIGVWGASLFSYKRLRQQSRRSLSERWASRLE